MRTPQAFLAGATGTLLMAVGAVGATVLPVDVAKTPTGAGVVSSVLFYSAGNVNDGTGFSQVDCGPDGSSKIWAAVTWTQPQTFNRIIFEQCPSYVVQGYDLQYSTVASPNPGNNSDWVTLSGGSFTGQSSTSTPVRSFGGTFTATGLRMLATATNGSTGADLRAREIWAFQNYDNRALTATITAPGWTGVARLNDEGTQVQEYTSNVSANPCINFTWATPQTLAGIFVVGGSGAVSEHLIDFKLQYFSGGQWLDALSVTGNTLKDYWQEFAPQTSTQFRLNIAKADNSVTDGYARVSEAMLFPMIPEPASLSLLALGGLALLRRRPRRT